MLWLNDIFYAAEIFDNLFLPLQQITVSQYNISLVDEDEYRRNSAGICLKFCNNTSYSHELLGIVLLKRGTY